MDENLLNDINKKLEEMTTYLRFLAMNELSRRWYIGGDRMDRTHVINMTRNCVNEVLYLVEPRFPLASDPEPEKPEVSDSQCSAEGSQGKVQENP
jgi:hypothetical protein